MNMAVYVPIIDHVDFSDPVGRREINYPPINIRVIEISNTGKVNVSFEPPLSSSVLNKIVAEDIVVSIRCDDEKESAKEELAFEYVFTLMEKDRLELQLNFHDPSNVSIDDYVIIKFHREIFNSAVFYEENADLLIDIDTKNFTRSMNDYDSVNKVMPAQMNIERLELVDNMTFVI